MQGVSAHLVTLKKSDKNRRHPARCQFAEGIGKKRICKCPRSQRFILPCHSAVRCDYYAEK
jgi:hypothetical protein